MMRLESDLLEALYAAAAGLLGDLQPLTWSEQVALLVVHANKVLLLPLINPTVETLPDSYLVVITTVVSKQYVVRATSVSSPTSQRLIPNEGTDSHTVARGL